MIWACVLLSSSLRHAHCTRFSFAPALGSAGLPQSVHVGASRIRKLCMPVLMEHYLRSFELVRANPQAGVGVT